MTEVRDDVTEAVSRRAARVLLVDSADRVLLFSGRDPARPEHRYWFTPGGGLAEGEPPAAGAVRELAEETGLRLTADQVGDPVWRDEITFPFDGVWYRQEQEFFFVRVPAWTVDTGGFDEVERGSIDGHRWWTLAELEATQMRYYPAALPAVLRHVLAGEVRC